MNPLGINVVEKDGYVLVKVSYMDSDKIVGDVRGRVYSFVAVNSTTLRTADPVPDCIRRKVVDETSYDSFYYGETSPPRKRDGVVIDLT